MKNEPKIYREEIYREFKILFVQTATRSIPSQEGTPTLYLNCYILHYNNRVFYEGRTYFFKDNINQYLEEAKEEIDRYYFQKFFVGDFVTTENGGTGVIEEVSDGSYSVDWITQDDGDNLKTAWWDDDEGLILAKPLGNEAGAFFDLSKIDR